MFVFDGIEADILGFKVPLPKFNSDAGFVEVQVRHTWKPLSLTLPLNPRALSLEQWAVGGALG